MRIFNTLISLSVAVLLVLLISTFVFSTVVFSQSPTTITVSNLSESSQSSNALRSYDDNVEHYTAFTTGPVSTGYSITEVSFDSASATTTGTIDINIFRAGTNGRPTGATLGTTAITSTAATVETHTLTTPISVDANTTYLIAFKRSAGSSKEVYWNSTRNPGETNTPSDAGWSISDASSFRTQDGGTTYFDYGVNQKLKFSVTATYDSSTEQPTVTVSTNAVTVTEASGATNTVEYTVVLDTQPTGTVTITPTSDTQSVATVSPASITFTSSDWNTPKTITVTGVDDDQDNDGRTATISHAVSGYETVTTAPSVIVTLTDDDTAGVTVSKSAVTVTEASGATNTAEYTIVLHSQPSGVVTITPSSDTQSVATVSPASITFTSSDWNTPKTITITGVDDAEVNAGRTATISHAVSGYGTIVTTAPSVTVTLTDDDSCWSHCFKKCGNGNRSIWYIKHC